MKPTMLVIGDSFMSQDPNHPGEHWSEMLPEYNVVNLAKGGASLTWIVDQLIDGLAHSPAVAVVGLTDEARITFDHEDGTSYSSCHSWRLTTDQKLLYTLWLSVMSSKNKYLLAYSQISFIFETLHRYNIPFVWHRGLFDSVNRNQSHATHDTTRFDFVLDKYRDQELTQDIWEHLHTIHPTFHVNNRNWQMQFANNVRTMLTNTQ